MNDLHMFGAPENDLLMFGAPGSGVARTSDLQMKGQVIKRSKWVSGGSGP